MIKSLIEFSSELDEKGLYLQANKIDEIIAKMASGGYDDLQIEDAPGFAAAEAEHEYNNQLNRLAPLAEALVRGGTPITGTSEEGDADEAAAIRELAEAILENDLFDAGIKILDLLSNIGDSEPGDRDPNSPPWPELEDDTPF